MSETGIDFLDDSTGEAVEIIDAEAVSPRGTPCAACGAPVEPLDHFCGACGATNRDCTAPVVGTDVPEPPTPQKYFRCEGCGAEVGMDPDQRSYVCAFCDSSYVVEFSREQTGRQRPEFVIGFALTHEQAMDKFRQWIRSNSWFRPGDLKSAQIADKMKGIYLPFWSFSMLAESNWNSQIGEHWYRTETYTTRGSDGKTVTRTRRVQETEWWPLSGRHHRYYAGFLVSGSKGLSQPDAERIKPFQLPALKRYEPYFLAGWLCEEYSVARDQALHICQREFYRHEQANVADFMPGDTHRSLQVETRFSRINSDLCLLPIYILSYRYNDKIYRFLINGQTGKSDGDKPVSGARIGVAIAVAVAAIAVVGLAIALAVGG